MFNVIKATGEKEPFSEEKVLSSIKRAGVPDSLQKFVLDKVKKSLYDNIPTSEIYEIIIRTLSESEQPYSRARYSLKQAIMMLGPTGYPFEDFVAKVLSEHGYKTKTRQILSGRCVTHEVDIIAEKAGKRIMVETKFHNNSGTRSDVHVALYVKARFDDLKDRYEFNEGWIITNTKSTIDANTYAECSGMKIISWNYPQGESLRELVEASHLHPITMLTTLSTSQKLKLLNNKIIMCRDLLTHKSYLEMIGLSPKEKDDTLNEIKYICTAPFERERI
jgi:hypothetical protein